MPIELTCAVLLVANAILILLIIMLAKKFKLNKLRNYIKELENEKLENHEEILSLQYEISLYTEKRNVPNRKATRFELINMN